MTPPGPLRRLPTASLVRLLLACAAVALAAYAQWRPAPAGSFLADEWLRDRFIGLQLDNAAEPRVLVVDIDEASMAALGAWPWPRARLAALVETLLADYAAAGVALDIVLPAPGEAAGDARLALLAEHGPLVLAQAFDYSAQRPAPLREGRLAGGRPAGAGAAAAATGYIGNHAGLARARHVGNIGFLPDPDGALRRLPLLTRFEGRDYPTLALALLECCGPPAAAAAAPAGAALSRVGFGRDWPAYTVVSAADVLAGRVAAAGAAGRLVLVGSSALGLADRVATPLAANRPGLGVQAAMLSTLLDRRAGRAPAPWPGRALALLYAAAAVGLASYALPRLAALASVALLAGAALLWLGLAYLVCPHDEALSSTGPLAALAFMLACAVPFQWQLAQRRSRRLLETLRQYVAPAVVQQLLRSDLADPLAPRQLDVTTLIADMEGYTGHVESLPVEQAATLTRDFLACLTGPVIEQLGTLDKYTGDGLVAFWGAPLPQAEHADLALAAGRAIVRRVGALSAARVAAGHAPLRVRIGIESGPAMAGDFGTSFRSIYTAVGDSVNTAARLEQAARGFAHDIIVGAGTVARARRHRFLPLGQQRLRGKERPVDLFTPDPSMDLAMDTPIPPHRAAAERPA